MEMKKLRKMKQFLHDVGNRKDDCFLCCLAFRDNDGIAKAGNVFLRQKLKINIILNKQKVGKLLEI